MVIWRLSGIQFGAINRYLSLASKRKTEKYEMVFRVPRDKVWGIRDVYMIDPVGPSGIWVKNRMISYRLIMAYKQKNQILVRLKAVV